MSNLLIRPAIEADLASINDIYNHYVQHTHITFDIEPWSAQKRLAWFSQFNGKSYQLWVAEVDGQVRAFVYTGQFRAKAAYDKSAEVTIYAHHQLQTKGIGTALYDQLLLNLAETGLHRLYAVIALPNDVSIGLHKKLGFEQVGLLNEVGTKLGKKISVAMLEKRL
ncbi:MAG TPA: GNAT family N-acetyltransferase [Oceanospirillaceae bacterium]|nr:GNAT family N-acetyltransferase [Oceanospirillaceae bacterium]